MTLLFASNCRCPASYSYWSICLDWSFDLISSCNSYSWAWDSRWLFTSCSTFFYFINSSAFSYSISCLVLLLRDSVFISAWERPLCSKRMMISYEHIERIGMQNVLFGTYNSSGYFFWTIKEHFSQVWSFCSC